MEPSGPADLFCGHPMAGSFGFNLGGESRAKRLPTFCKKREHFKQHPGRNPDGSLKGGF